MSKPPLPEEVVALLAKANPAVMATVRPDGQPVSTATWYLWDDGRVLLTLDEGRARLNHLRNDPRMTLTVLDEADWYSHVSIIGRACDIREDKGLVEADRVSRHYLGRPYAIRDRRRVSVWIEIDRWHGWGALKDSAQAG